MRSHGPAGAEQAAVLLAPGPRILHPVAAPFPIIKSPMAATEVARPFHRPGWVCEEKVDGWRVLAYKNAAGVRLISRNGRDLTRRFPELAAAVDKLEAPTLALDGGIAVFDRQLVSRFEWLRGRPKDDTATPPLLMAFDCLYARGKDLRGRCGCAGSHWPTSGGSTTIAAPCSPAPRRLESVRSSRVTCRGLFWRIA